MVLYTIILIKTMQNGILNDETLIIKAIKDIYPDQEIYVNYGSNYWTSRSEKL